MTFKAINSKEKVEIVRKVNRVNIKNILQGPTAAIIADTDTVTSSVSGL